LIHAQNILRPQLKFQEPVDNSPNAIFKPKLVGKPNALVPLNHQETKLVTGDEAQHNGLVSTHPYAYELEHITYPKFMFEVKEPIKYKGFENTSLHMVSTMAQLEDLASKLEKQSEIAIDLEVN
jgi:exosome complex exonuclease RRP6